MTEPAIRIDGVSKRYGAVRALDGLDLEIPQGSIYGLIGPNGAGKTTAFSIVCGWVRPDAGSVTVLGAAPSRVARIKGRLGTLPQDAALPPTVRVRDSLVFYGRLQGLERSEAGREADRVLELVGLSQWAAMQARGLSHGMAKRVGLAQAFLGHPELVLLDEPTAGLDPKSAAHVRELVAAGRGRATVVVSSHNLYELEALCDRAALLDRGRLVIEGPMERLTSADREVIVELADPPEHLEAYVRAVQAVPTVASASLDPARGWLLVRYAAAEPRPADVVTAVLRSLLDSGAHVSQVRRGQGLEKTVLSL